MASLFAAFPGEVSPSGSATTAGQFRAFWADAFGESINDQPQIDALVAATKAAHGVRTVGAEHKLRVRQRPAPAF